MEKVNIEDLEKGDLIMVRWLDASEIRCSVDEHEGSPEVFCKDWGVYLGVSGRKRRLLLVEVCVRLREEGRMAGRGRLPEGFGRRSR